MEINNAASMIYPTSDNYTDPFLSTSTGYLEDALIEFSVRFKRRRLVFNAIDQEHEQLQCEHEQLQCDPFSGHFTDDYSSWSNWLPNCCMQSEEELSHSSVLSEHEKHYLAGEDTENSLKEIYEGVINVPETSTLLIEDVVSTRSTPKPQEMSSYSKDDSVKSKSVGLAYSSDTYSIDSSSISDDKEKVRKKIKVNKTSGSTTKMVYPFGLVKPGGEVGDVTLNDINKRLLMPPTRPLKHPVGEFACRPAVSPDGLGLSGKAVVALTRIHTQGRGTITIIRTKG